MKKIYTHKEIAIAVLGYELYLHLYHIFKKIALSDEYRVKIFMARKCYGLYKVFESILRDDGIMPLGIVTNDKAFGMLAHSIKEDESILVIDDTMLFGRTVRTFVMRDLREAHNINLTRIHVFIIVANNALYGDTSVIAGMEDGFFVCKNEADALFTKYKLMQEPIRCDSRIVRSYSAKFLEVIHATSTPYVAYIPAFTLKKEEIRRIFKTTDFDAIIQSGAPQDLLTEKLRHFPSYDISTREQEDWDVRTVCLVLKADADFSYTLFSCVRINVNSLTESLTIIPYVVFSSLEKTGKMDVMNSSPLLFHQELNDNRVSVPVEVRFLRYAASYLAGRRFLEMAGLNVRDTSLISDGGFANDKIIKDLNSCAPESVNRILQSSFKVVSADKFENVEKKKVFADLFKQYKSEDLFQSLSTCFYRLLQEDAPANSHERNKGILIDTLVTNYKELYSSSMDKIAAAVVRLTDAGRSVMYVSGPDYNVSYAGCYIQNGEQAIQVLSHLCDGLAYAVSYLYKKLGEIGWERHKESIKQYIHNYMSKNHEEVKHELIDLLIDTDSPRPDEYYVNALEEVLPSGSEDAEFFVGFAGLFKAYADKGAEGSFLDFLKSLGENNALQGREEYFRLANQEEYLSSEKLANE